MRFRVLAAALLATCAAGVPALLAASQSSRSSVPAVESEARARPPLHAPEPPPLRDCAQRVEGGRPSDTTALPGQVVLGPFRFAGLARLADRRELEINHSGTRYGVKAGVGVPAGARATLSIGRSARSWASLDYAFRPSGEPHRTYHTVRFQACEADQRAFSYDGHVGPITGFSGGFVLRRPGCVPLKARVSGRPAVRRTIRFGVRRCP